MLFKHAMMVLAMCAASPAYAQEVPAPKEEATFMPLEMVGIPIVALESLCDAWWKHPLPESVGRAVGALVLKGILSSEERAEALKFATDEQLEAYALTTQVCGVIESPDEVARVLERDAPMFLEKR